MINVKHYVIISNKTKELSPDCVGDKLSDIYQKCIVVIRQAEETYRELVHKVTIYGDDNIWQTVIRSLPSAAGHKTLLLQRKELNGDFLAMLKKAGLKCQTLIQVYRGLVESVLTNDITVRFGNTALAEMK